MSGPWVPTPTRWASGAGALPSAGWTGLYDEPCSGTPRKIGDERTAEIIGRTLEETQPDSTHWSLRSMARASGYAPSIIHQIWQAFSLQPHRPVGLNLSSDPLFVAKVRDIVGLYLRAAMSCSHMGRLLTGRWKPVGRRPADDGPAGRPVTGPLSPAAGGRGKVPWRSNPSIGPRKCGC